MISLKLLSKDLEDKLNAAIQSGDYDLGVPPNEKYLFNIVLDAGEYRNPYREGNTVTRFINGVMDVTSDDKVGISESSINAVISASFEFVVPYIGNEYDEENLPNAIRDLVDETLTASAQQYLLDEQGNTFLVTSNYTFANTGEKDMRYKLGDSISYTIFIDYAIIAAGVSSAMLEVYLGDERIYPTRIDITRQSVQEGVIPSNDVVSKTATQSTQMTVSITKPVRFDAFDSAAINYIMEHTVTPLEVTIKYPTSIAEGVVEKTARVYRLSFADAAIAGELNLAIPITATMHEEVSYG